MSLINTTSTTIYPLYPIHTCQSYPDIHILQKGLSQQTATGLHSNNNVIHLVELNELFKKFNPWADGNAPQKSETPLKDQLAEDECETRLERAKKSFLSCTHAQKLWRKVEEKGKFSIGCAPLKQVPTGANVDLNARRILIEENQKLIAPNLLFELNNLKQSERAFQTIMKRCDLSPEEYAKGIETLEHQSLQDSYKLAGLCVKEKKWPTKWQQFFLQLFSASELSNEKLFLKVQEETGHTDVVKKQWYEECQPEKLEDWKRSIAPKWPMRLLKEQERKKRKI